MSRRTTNSSPASSSTATPATWSGRRSRPVDLGALALAPADVSQAAATSRLPVAGQDDHPAAFPAGMPLTFAETRTQPAAGETTAAIVTPGTPSPRKVTPWRERRW
jgi:hypothetical protein